jgi:c-di-AMP phosphodiesterase-like protein
LLRYVQDRDLWRWELDDSREFSAALAVEPRTFERWDEIASYIDEDGIRSRHYYPFVNRGYAILAAQSQHVESLASRAGFRVIAGHRVPAVNSPLFQSEIGHRLCELHGDCPFACVWFQDERTRDEIWSLRSRGDFDVSAVAKSYGGGGHAAAAGFRCGAGGWEAGSWVEVTS